MGTSATWNDTNRCPYCGGHLSSPGAGFIDHLSENPDCESEFETWRRRIGSDLRGGWSG